MRSLFIALVLLVGTMQLSAQKVKHIILVSIDGFRPDFYLDSTWPAPNMQYLSKLGVSAKGVEGVFPSVTYPSHTSILTGAYPAEHGIYYNTPFQPLGATGIWNSETELIKTKTLWTALKESGLKTASVSWPVSVGADVDYNIPEAFTLKNPLDRREPTSLHATPKGLFEEVQQKATGQMEAVDLNINHTKMDENIGRIGAYLFRTYKPSLLTIHLPGVDHAQHSQGRSGQLVKAAIANADRVIGSIWETVTLSGMADSTAIIITGDHGFVTVNKSFSPNILLVQAGLLDAKDGAEREWKAQFNSGGGSVFLQLKDPSDKQTLDKVLNILSTQPDSIRKMFRVVDQSTLRKAGADPNAALALAAVQGVSINTKTEGNLVSPGKGGAHGYFPDFREIQTGFIGFGAGFANKKVIDYMKLIDIAPMVAKMLDVSFKKGNDQLNHSVLIK
jgi:predicted AlkP superfamily pyrophosphatase or phosphodiesterase